jgi:hypothetical protein
MGRKTDNQLADRVRKTNGKIGELLSAVELLKHGFNVSWPVVDSGYDLIADDGKGVVLRLQVKTAVPDASRTYNILFAHGRITKKLYDKSVCDTFIVALQYPAGAAFYVIPIDDVISMKGIFWPPGQHPRYPEKWKTSKYEGFRDRWDLLR